MKRPRALLAPLDVAHVLTVRRARGLVAIFDLDGTLAPIAPTPQAARIPHATRRALHRLAQRHDTTVGIVSGRPLVQVERLVGRSRLWLAGLHGAVRRAPGEPVRRLWSRDLQLTSTHLASALSGVLGEVAGVMIEPKGPAVAVHVRAAAPAGRTRARIVVSRLRPAGWRLLEGRRVFELLPAGLPSKGDAVRWIAAGRPAATIIYLGDDATDEDAFRALRGGDFPVVVDRARARAERPPGGASTSARFVLRGSDAVRALLERLTSDDPKPRASGRPPRGNRGHCAD
jgi:trehalose 6-phosphate phosphatase